MIWGKGEVGEYWEAWREEKLQLDVLYERKINKKENVQVKENSCENTVELPSQKELHLINNIS